VEVHVRRLLILLLLFAAFPVSAQHLDFARVFPPEERQMAEFQTALARLEAYRGRVARKAGDAIGAYNDALAAYVRLDAFFYLHSAVDTTDARSKELEASVSAEFEKRTAFFLREVASAKSKRYAWFVTLPRPVTLTTGWEAELHDQLDARKQTAADRDLYAFALMHLAREGNAAAKATGYADAATAVYALSQLTKADVTRLLEDVAAQADRYKRYEAIRANRPRSESPRYTFEEARVILPRALAPLGAAYTAELSKLLDPAAGRIDIGPGEHRRRGGFSKGFSNFPSVFYMQAFTGAYNDLRIVTHESTHAVQRQLQAAAGLPPVYLDGAKYLFEACAIFNELVLPEYLAGQTSDPAQRRFFLEQFLDSKGIAVVFTAAAEAAIEQAVYDGVANGTIRGADDLDALNARIAARYSSAPRVQWTGIRLMYDDPFYDVNYVVAGLVALRMYARYKSDPAHFLPGYTALLANGFTAPADELLRRFTGIDIRDPDFVADALQSVQPKIDELERLYTSPR
jgi:oligoendopeptidase F